MAFLVHQNCTAQKINDFNWNIPTQAKKSLNWELKGRDQTCWFGETQIPKSKRSHFTNNSGNSGISRFQCRNAFDSVSIHSLLRSTNNWIPTFPEVIKLVVLEKYEFGNRHLSIALAFWLSRTIMILTQLKHSVFSKFVTPPTNNETG